MNTILAWTGALARPVATVLIAGGLKALTDYQANPHWQPALVDGGITALSVAGALLGIGGIMYGAQTVQAKQAAASPVTPTRT